MRIVNKLWLVLGFVVMANLLFGQTSECDEEVSEKAKKLVEKAKDRKKYDKAKRVEFLRSALEEEEEYIEANFMLAVEILKTAKAEGGGHSRAIKYLDRIVNNCPDYHSDVYYYLGAIYNGKLDYLKAVGYQKKFLDFKSDDMSKFSKKYEKHLAFTQEDYVYAKFYSDHVNNPVPFDPKVVRDVSTNDGDEYLPLLSPDNELLLFTRGANQKTKSITAPTVYVENFVISKYANGAFEVGEPMPQPFNKKKDVNYGGVSLSLNNKHLYITICTPYFNKAMNQMSKNCDIYQSDYVFGLNPFTHKEEWHWTEPKNLGPNINTPTGWEAQPSVSADGKHLFFASVREGSAGIDIFMSERTVSGEWGVATALPAPVNTEKNDKTPFIHTDSRSLYFSSQGHLGFGGYDIYYVKQNEDGSWGEPKNIGYPINTDEDEHGFVVSTSGTKVYYSSAHLGNKRTRLNILSFDLYKEARPDQVVLVKGKVEEKSSSAPKKVSLKNMTTKKITKFDVDEDGSYAAVMRVKPGDKVIMKVEGEGVAYNARVVEVPEPKTEAEEKAEEEKNKELAVSPPPAQKINVVAEKETTGGKYKLEDINYETSSADISDRSRVILDDFADYLKSNPRIKVAIHGHTDNVGSSSANLALSADRAYSVKSYLEEKGVQSNRLSFKGYGDTKPVASNATKEGRLQNRRTEFVILSK